jgi:uncharacterized protein (TIGR02246 family)
MRRQCLSLLTLLLIGACTPRTDPAAEEQAIREIIGQWLDAAARKDTTAIANFYAENGSFLPPNGPRLQGRDAIRGAWAGLLNMPGVSLTFAATEIGIAAAGDMAYDIGTYNLGLDGPEGRIEDEGKYVVVWTKVGNEWKAYADIFNSNKPAMAGPATEGTTP